MMKKQVWFGVFEFGDFMKCGDEYPMAIVRRLDAKIVMNPDDADDYMMENGFDSYLIPSQFNGEVYYAEAV
jgi:hypothetical protein